MLLRSTRLPFNLFYPLPFKPPSIGSPHGDAHKASNHHVSDRFCASSLTSCMIFGGVPPLRYCHSLEKSFTLIVALARLLIFNTGELTSETRESESAEFGVVFVIRDSRMRSWPLILEETR